MAQFAEPVVSFLLESISKLLLEEGKYLLGVNDEAQQLQSELKLMLSLIKTADQRWQDDNATLKEWISQSKDLAYEAENVLETLAFRAASRNVLKRSMCIFSECYMQHKVGSEILALKDRMSNLSRLFHEYGISELLEKEGPSSRQQQLIRRTYSHVEEDDFVGLEDDVNRVADALVNEYKVVSICGMGGLGKTTIARKVYNHPDVKRHFDHFAWVCISQQWQIRDILVRILIKIIPEKKKDIQKSENVDLLVQELYQVQQHKRCLIVLDDIWSSSAWDCMKNAFPERAEGSKILLTTRNKDVAIHIGPNGFHYEPRLLSKDESWELLRKKALKGRNFHAYGDMHKFEELGKQMVEYCKGLPLAVVVLGGILTCKHDLNEWEVVSKNVKFYLKKSEITGEETGEVQRILALSYNDLPYHLKPCFLYLGIYPEDCEIEAETLYQLWMAEGMVSKADRIGEESMMDTAERYLLELAKRSMVQVKVKDGPGIRKLQSCRLHDLMRDMCLRKGGEENFLKVIDYRSGDYTESTEINTSSTGKIHRLTIFLNPDDVSNYRPPKKQMVMHVRSLKFSAVGSGEYSGHLARTRFKNFKMLRALTIENFKFLEDETVTNIWRHFRSFHNSPPGNLVHLRYLCLRRSFCVSLSSSIRMLQHLETLDLRDSLILWDFAHRLRNLRHLYLPDFDNICCGKLQLAGLTKLEILENFSAKICHVKDLYKLTNLHLLSAYIDGDIDGGEVMNCIQNLSQLKQAQLSVDSFRGFERLFCSNLHHLSLLSSVWGYDVKLPEYRTGFFKYLIELQLLGFSLERDPMETLEKLPKLQRLWVKECIFVGKEMTSHAMGFSQLMFLKLENIKDLENWIIEEGAMPRLSQLHITRCYDLKMIPDGIRFVATLTELVITDMSPEFSDRVQVIHGQEGEDFDKVRHVASIVIR